MAIQRFEHVMAPEGTVDAMRELVEEAVKVLEGVFWQLPTLSQWDDWRQCKAKPFLAKARAALGEADRG